MKKRRRQAWREALAQFPVEQLIFLDESGATTQMTRNYGRAPLRPTWERGYAAGPMASLDHVGPLTTRGLEAPMTIAEPNDGDIFLAYL